MDTTIPNTPGTGENVRIGEGPLEGFEGTVVGRRESGRYVVQLSQGVYVEANVVRLSTPTTGS